MTVPLEQSKTLKQALLDFVLDAEGELATALETFSAEKYTQWSNHKLQNISQADLAINLFITEGQVENQSVLDLYLKNKPQLSPAEQALVQSWSRSFQGLFKVLELTPEGYRLMNWLTEKQYQVKSNGLQQEEILARLSPGEIVIAQLSPITATDWIFSGPLLLLGKLGKPKLAVAIGNFKNWFPNHLYGDAPELLEAAWQSVEDYHQEFVDFFGGDQVTLPGYELNKRLKAYQEATTQKRLEKAGLDGSKSLQDLADEAGVSKEEIKETVTAMGEDGKVVDRLLSSPKAVKMMMPPVQLPQELRQAEAVTVLVHPRWGQTFLKDYTQFVALLKDASDPAKAETSEPLDRLTQKYLQDGTVNSHLWHGFAQDYPAALEPSLQRILNRPEFDLQKDLDLILLKSGKSLTPQLPEIASVPIHLHNLFQEALQAVSQGSAKKKSKGKKKQKTGFGV